MLIRWVFYFTYCYAKCCHAGCHYAECHYAECNYSECNYSECNYSECNYAECHYAECFMIFIMLSAVMRRYTECHGANTLAYLILQQKSLKVHAHDFTENICCFHSLENRHILTFLCSNSHYYKTYRHTFNKHLAGKSWQRQTL